MHCPAEEWIKGSSITLECFVQKSKFPKLCVTQFVNKVRFRRTATGFGYAELCTLSAVTGACNASSSACICQPGNATHYKFTYTFIAGSDYNGYWDCSVPCFNTVVSQLSYSSDNCRNRIVIGKDRPVCLSLSLSLSLFVCLPPPLSLLLVKTDLSVCVCYLLSLLV